MFFLSPFVRAVAYSQGAIPPNGTKEGIPQMFHIMNAFDIPVGSAREISHGELHTDYTALHHCGMIVKFS